MPSSRQAKSVEEFHPLTSERWADLVALFEHHGYPGSCWCMWWRLRSTDYNQFNSAERKNALKSLVRRGTPLGILGYRDGEPAGWCSVAPRETYTRLERSTTLERIDDLPVWSVVCFYVKHQTRGQGFMLKLLQAAVAYAQFQDATIIEGYPVELHRDATGKWHGVGLSGWYMGSLVTFQQAGFEEVSITEQGRRIMRLWMTSSKRRTPTSTQKESK